MMPKKNNAFRSGVADLEESEEISAIQRKPLKCWSRSQPGHHFDDFLERRSIFCYGCFLTVFSRSDETDVSCIELFNTI